MKSLIFTGKFFSGHIFVSKVLITIWALGEKGGGIFYTAYLVT